MLRNPAGWPAGRQATFVDRLQASGVHLALSLLVASLAFSLVYFVWFPNDYWEMAGGRELFWLIVSVDIVLGPLVTLAIFNPGKGWRRLKWDLVVVAALQLTALGYGLWTVSSARPVYMVYTGDRFNMVTANALDPRDQALAQKAEFKNVPWTGPETVGTRAASSADENTQLISDALAGKDIELQPKFYIPFVESKERVLSKSKPIAELRKKNDPQKLAALDERLRRLQRKEDSVRWLPVIARGDWVVLLDASNGQPLSYLPLNGF